MLKFEGSKEVKIKGRGKFPKIYRINSFRCLQCGKTMKVDSSYVPPKCHHCNTPSELTPKMVEDAMTKETLGR